MPKNYIQWTSLFLFYKKNALLSIYSQWLKLAFLIWRTLTLSSCLNLLLRHRKSVFNPNPIGLTRSLICLPHLWNQSKNEVRVPFRAGLRLFWLLLSKNHFITRLSGASSARSVWFDSGRIVPLKVLHSSSSSSSKLNFIYIEDAQTRFSVEHGDSLCALYQCLTWSIAISFTPSLEQSPLNIDWWNIIPHLHLDHHTQSAIKQC